MSENNQKNNNTNPGKTPGTGSSQRSGQNPSQRPEQNPGTRPAQRSGARPTQRPGVRQGQRPGVRPGAQAGAAPVSQYKMPGGGMDDQKLKDYLKTVKPRRVFRGVNDEDMWAIISNVQKFYEKQYETEKARFEAVLAEKDREIFNLRKNQK